MSKTIPVADDIYEWMKEKIDDKSLSEFLRFLNVRKRGFSKISGGKLTGGIEWESLEDEFDEASGKTEKKLRERF